MKGATSEPPATRDSPDTREPGVTMELQGCPGFQEKWVQEAFLDPEASLDFQGLLVFLDPKAL